MIMEDLNKQRLIDGEIHTHRIRIAKMIGVYNIGGLKYWPLGKIEETDEPDTVLPKDIKSRLNA